MSVRTKGTKNRLEMPEQGGGGGRGGGGEWLGWRRGWRETKPWMKFVSRESNQDLYKLLNRLIQGICSRGGKVGRGRRFPHIHR